MVIQISEARMHLVRWILTVGWLLIIGSLFYDPWTARFTDPDHPWSPLRLSRQCVEVQGSCLIEQPYPLGTTVFWGVVVPAGIFILLVFGHELWRRICPLSFLSQIPRALGLQRQFERLNAITGKRRFEIAKVPADSWLGQHYQQLQFGWLFVGLCGRLLFFNADRIVLAGWLLFTIAAAIAVGYLFGGKAWCQYFCPMAPVQSIYSTPAGLLGSRAHTSEQLITQSMCRTVLPDQSEQSACVACQQPCIDIDAERMYWAGIDKPAAGFDRYGYVGLVIGYFGYYYLYAGNWDYYFSGAWLRQSDQLASLLRPGLFLWGQPINLPKLVAVPLVLGLCTWLGALCGRWIENRGRISAHRHEAGPAFTVVRHRLFCLCTFAIFNVFFLFAGRPLIQLLPLWVQTFYDLLLMMLSTLWLYRAWNRDPDLYGRENLASRFRKQLERLQLNVAQYLDGRSLAELNTHEVYVLAKVLPGFTREKRQEAYKGVVRDALAEGYVNVASSLDVLQQMRVELGVSDAEHEQLLEELGVEDPDLLDPDSRRSLENQVRLNGYRQSLERLLLLQARQQGSATPSMLTPLELEYAITDQEQENVLDGLKPAVGAARKVEALLDRLPGLSETWRALHQPSVPQHPFVRIVLTDHIRHRLELSMGAILEAFVILQDDPVLPGLVVRLRAQSPLVLLEMLERGPWRQRLSPQLFADLNAPGAEPSACSLEIPLPVTLGHLETLLQERTPTTAAAALFLLAQLDRSRARQLAGALSTAPVAQLLGQTAQQLLNLEAAELVLADLPALELRLCLAASDFFRRTRPETLEALADASSVHTYAAGELITEAGDTCRELLLLIDGEAVIHYQEEQRVRLEPLKPGQVLDELEVLTHSATENTIVAERDNTRLLAVPVDSFDAMLDQDHDLGRRVLELESRHLQRFMRSVQA
ncbi:cyclic nucleotide-binding domain-containing protein [Synechococcus sp. CS-1325]|nr:cyclic nucleotide-binding domain-containing protein [Synechococcus sp. CS-1325]PZV01592.1 MAG: cyclic nucleotide-binding protein [Cyanobium sp.]